MRAWILNTHVLEECWYYGHLSKDLVMHSGGFLGENVNGSNIIYRIALNLYFDDTCCILYHFSSLRSHGFLKVVVVEDESPTHVSYMLIAWGFKVSTAMLLTYFLVIQGPIHHGLWIVCNKMKKDPSRTFWPRWMQHYIWYLLDL